MALHLINCYKKYLQNLKYIVKRGCIFHLIWVGILSILIDIVHKEQGRYGGFAYWAKSVKRDELFVGNPLLRYQWSIKKKWNFENVWSIKNNVEFPHGSWSEALFSLEFPRVKSQTTLNHPVSIWIFSGIAHNLYCAIWWSRGVPASNKMKNNFFLQK